MLATLLLVVTAESAVTADGLMAQVMDRARLAAILRHERGLTGTKLEETHDIRNKPEKLTEVKRFQVAMAPDGILHRLVSINGRPTTGPMERPKLDPTTFIVTLHEKFTFRMASPEPVDGYYSIAFEPKNPDGPAADDQEMVINHLSGIIYIHQHGLYVRRLQGWLEKSFAIKGIGRVQEATVVLDQELVEGLPVPRRSVFSVRYSKFFGLGFYTATRTTVSYEYDLRPVITTPSP